MIRSADLFELRRKVRGLWRPPEKITVSECAEKVRVLEGESAAEPGPWRNSRTPYLVGIMDEFCNPLTEKIVFLKPTQVGGSEAIFNIIFWAIMEDPGPTLVVYPDDGNGREVCKTRFQPAVNASEALSEKKPSDPDDFSLSLMAFPGMPIYIVGANSPTSLGGKPCRYVFLDEADKFPAFSGREADPFSLAGERQKTFWNKKSVLASTPTIPTGPTNTAYEACDERRHFEMPCPHCGAVQAFDFDQLRYPDTLDKTAIDFLTRIQRSAWYECAHCNGSIFDSHKMNMMRAGRWTPEKKHPCPKAIGFHLNSIYSPFLTFGDCARAREEAEADDAPLSKKMNFVNSWKGLPFKNTVGNLDKIDLSARVLDIPSLVVPSRAVALTLGIDMQKVGFYATLWAFSEALESWKVAHYFLPGWDDISKLVFDTSFPREGTGQRLCIWRAALDTGGGAVNRSGDEGRIADDDWSRTAEAYYWIRNNGRNVIFATKGRSTINPGTPLATYSVIDRMPGKKAEIIPGGLTLWMINTERLKELFFNRMGQTDGDSQPMHFCAGTGKDFFDQLTAEERRRNKKGLLYWHRVRKANHYLDASLLAHACADPEWAGGVPLLAAEIAELERRQEKQNKDNDPSGGWIAPRDSWLRRR